MNMTCLRRALAATGWSAGIVLAAVAALACQPRSSHALDGGAARPGAPVTSTAAATITVVAPVRLGVGGEPGLVDVRVAEPSGGPVADGTPVQLDVTSGQLDQGHLTTASGRATTTLRSGRVAGVAWVTARVGELVTTTQTLYVAGPPDSLSLLASAQASVSRALTVTVAVADAYGNAAGDGLTAELTATAGAITPTVATLSGGRAEVTWRSTVAGTATITGTCQEASGSTRVSFAPGPAAELDVWAQPSAIALQDGEASVIARLYDRYGNAAPESRMVHFEATGGTVAPASMRTEEGTARTTYHAGDQVGQYDVRAQSGELQGSAAIRVMPADLWLSSAEMRGPRGPAASSQTYPGEVVTYSLRVENKGMATARDVRLAAEVPRLIDMAVSDTSAGVRSIDPPPDDILGPSPDGYGQRAWSLPYLEAGARAEVTLSGPVSADHEWSGFDALLARAAVTTTTAEATPFDNTRSDAVNVYAADVYATLAIDELASAIRPGGWLVYDLSFGNRQAQTLVSGVRLTDTLGAGLSYDHWQPGIGTSLEPVGVFSAESREVAWDLEGPFGLSPSLRLWLNIDSDVLPDTIVENSVSIDSPVYDVDSTNNHRSVTARLGGVNLSVQLNAPETASPGEDMGYEVVVRNAVAKDSAHDVQIDVGLPSGLTVERTHPLGIVLVGGRVQWNLADLPAGDERRFEVVATVPVSTPLGTYLHGSASTQCREVDGYQVDNTDEGWTLVVPGEAAAIDVEPAATEVRACSNEQVVIAAAARDQVGYAVADGTRLQWSVTNGNVANAVTTTEDGRSENVVTAGDDVGPLEVTVSSGEATASATIDLTAGPPREVRVAIQPQHLGVGQKAAVAVDVLAACANPVSDGWPVELTVDGGRLAGGRGDVVLLTVQGHVATTVAADADGGPLTVTARAGAAVGSAVAEAERPAVFRAFLPLALLR